MLKVCKNIQECRGEAEMSKCAADSGCQISMNRESAP